MCMYTDHQWDVGMFPGAQKDHDKDKDKDKGKNVDTFTHHVVDATTLPRMRVAVTLAEQVPINISPNSVL